MFHRDLPSSECPSDWSLREVTSRPYRRVGTPRLRPTGPDPTSKGGPLTSKAGSFPEGVGRFVDRTGPGVDLCRRRQGILGTSSSPRYIAPRGRTWSGRGRHGSRWSSGFSGSNVAGAPGSFYNRPNCSSTWSGTDTSTRSRSSHRASIGVWTRSPSDRGVRSVTTTSDPGVSRQTSMSYGGRRVRTRSACVVPTTGWKSTDGWSRLNARARNPGALPLYLAKWRISAGRRNLAWTFPPPWVRVSLPLGVHRVSVSPCWTVWGNSQVCAPCHHIDRRQSLGTGPIIVLVCLEVGSPTQTPLGRCLLGPGWT